jgi:hypothetical protein
MTDETMAPLAQYAIATYSGNEEMHLITKNKKSSTVNNPAQRPSHNLILYAEISSPSKFKQMKKVHPNETFYSQATRFSRKRYDAHLITTPGILKEVVYMQQSQSP